MADTLTIHHTIDPYADTGVPDPHQDNYSKTTLGFWMYLMTDCILFGTLFTIYALFHKSTFGGPSSKDIFSLPTAFIETMILLLSTLTCGLAVLSSLKSKKKSVIGWLFFTFLLGISFLIIEVTEFAFLINEGHDWTKSAFLSSFFTLVGTHGLHVFFGLLWVVVMIGQIFFYGITVTTFRRLAIFSLFWHFLDLVWIFIFSFVYLVGVA